MSASHRVRRSLRKPAEETARRHTKKPQNRSADLSEILGASQSFSVGNKPHGPFGVAALLHEIQTRLVSQGGRPSEVGPTIRRLVPMRAKVWKTLKAQADSLSKRGRRVSPAQLAALLVEKSLSELAIQQNREGDGRD